MNNTVSRSLYLSRIFIFLLISFFIVSLVGCGGKTAVKSEKAKSAMQPDWILNTPIEPGALYGVGSAEIFAGNEAGAIARAKDMARVELVKQIKVNVSGEVEQEISETVKNSESNVTKKLRQAVKSQVPEFKLTNVKSVDSYKSKNRVYVLVKLDVTKELQILQGKISDLDSQISEYEQKFNKNNPMGMSAIRLIAPVLVLIDQRGQLQARYNALAQKSLPLIPMDTRDFVAKLYARIAQMTVSIQAQGEDNSALKTGLIANLTEKGMHISESGKADLLFTYKLKVNSIKREGSYYAITNGDVWIKDENGKVIKAFQARAKGVSSDATEAESRSIKKLSDQLGKEMMSALF